MKDHTATTALSFPMLGLHIPKPNKVLRIVRNLFSTAPVCFFGRLGKGYLLKLGPHDVYLLLALIAIQSKFQRASRTDEKPACIEMHENQPIKVQSVSVT